MPTSSPARPAPTRGMPLRVWLVLVNLVILLVIVSASIWVAWENGDRAVDDLAGQIQRRAGSQVESHLRAYLEAPHTVTQLMADAIDLGDVSPEDPQSLYRYLYRLSALFTGVSYLNVATEDGRFFGLGRSANKTDALVVEESSPEHPGILHQFAINADGTRGAALRNLPFGDFRTQVWYREPRERGAGVWTSIYSWTDNPEILVASAGIPVHGAFEGVVGVDMFLSSISEYLAGLDISPSARAFIMERNGLLVASSLGRLPFQLGPDGALRLHASQAGDPAIADAVARLESLPAACPGSVPRAISNSCRPTSGT